MNQQAYQEQVRGNEVVYEVLSGFGRFLVSVLRVSYGVIRKFAANVAIGFHIFTDTAEQHGLPRR